MRYKATIDIYIEMGGQWVGDADGALADGIHAMLDDVQDRTASAGDDFVLIDWSYNPHPTFEANYALPFDGQTPEEELQASLEIEFANLDDADLAQKFKDAGGND